MRFTDKAIQALKRQRQRYEIVESGTGLTVRVSVRGIKTFTYLYRARGKPRRMTLGVYRDPGLAGRAAGDEHDARGLPYLSLADARVKLAKAQKLRESGIDPGTEAAKAHRTEQKAQTVGELIDVYLERYAKATKKPSGAAEDERMLEKDVRPRWGDRKVTGIKRQDVIDLLDGIVARGAPVIANRTLAVVRKMFRWAVRRGIVARSPVIEIEAPGGREKARERVLTDAEIAEVWRGAEKLPQPYSQLVRLLLVTGQRRGEVAGMRRDTEIDDQAKLWTIPKARTKNSLDHEVPLSKLARDIIAELPAALGDVRLAHVFVSGRRGDTPIREFKNAKRRLDDLILEARRDALQAEGDDPAEAKPMPHWTLHDLRRTMRTGLSKLRLDPEICERAINHVPAGVRRTYDVHAYRDEKREVLNAWAAHLRRVVTAKPATGGKVVRLRHATG